jgi:hypothetical protein
MIRIDFWFVNEHHEVDCRRHPAYQYRKEVISIQHSAFSIQHSAFGIQHSAVSSEK